MEVNKVYNEDCRETMKRMEDNSVDSIVTDPPYDLTTTKRWGKESKFSQNQSDVGKRFSKGFMGKEWDGTGIAFEIDLWKECLRVLKPGGYLLAFGGTRTQHRMVCAIEDAGFEIRDTILWLYGSGFPKSLDVAKAIEGKLTIGSSNTKDQKKLNGRTYDVSSGQGGMDIRSDYRKTSYQRQKTDVEFSMDEAKQYEGWGTALKPACEPICVARKPLSEKTVAENVLKWGVGGINIDGCRVETKDNLNGGGYGENFEGSTFQAHKSKTEFVQPSGRFPANVIHDGSEEVLQGFPESTSGEMDSISQGKSYGIYGKYNGKHVTNKASSGSAARFFYVPKADSKERQDGCYEMEKKPSGMISNTSGQHITRRDGGAPQPKGNNHPTVKPIALIQYLQRLVTPKGGLTYDPFGGSGTGALSASNEGFKWILSELIAEHCDIANKRIYNNNGLFA